MTSWGPNSTNAPWAQLVCAVTGAGRRSLGRTLWPGDQQAKMAQGTWTSAVGAQHDGDKGTLKGASMPYLEVSLYPRQRWQRVHTHPVPRQRQVQPQVLLVGALPRGEGLQRP